MHLFTVGVSVEQIVFLIHSLPRVVTLRTFHRRIFNIVSGELISNTCQVAELMSCTCSVGWSLSIANGYDDALEICLCIFMGFCVGNGALHGALEICLCMGFGKGALTKRFGHMLVHGFC